MKTDKYIECAKIINTHGCHDGLKLESWCNTPEDLADLRVVFIKEGELYKKLKVKSSSVFKQFVIVELDQVNTMDEAMLMKNKMKPLEKN